MKELNQKPFAIYSRKSKITGKGESIENQIEMCRRHIELLFGKDAADSAIVYEDEGFSGGNLDRPQFKKMLEDACNEKIRAIVVYRLDRISRSITDFSYLIDAFEKHQVGFISISEQFDTTTPMGRAMMFIASIFAQLERETIAERIRDNMRELAKSGRWLGGVTPTGYQSKEVNSVSVDGKAHKAYKLEIIPTEKAIVQTIFDKFLETGSLTKTDQFLLQKRYLTKNGLSFNRFTIKNILSNPVYMMADGDAWDYFEKNNIELFCEQRMFDGKHGIMAYNRTHQRRGKTHLVKPMSEWIISVGRHIGIIPGVKWVQAQHLLALNSSKKYRKPRSNVALLSGLLYCADCGAYMRPKLTERLNTAGERIYTYLCTNKERSRSEICAMKNVNGNILDEKIIDILKSFDEQNETIAKQIAAIKKRIHAAKDGCEAEMINLKTQIEEKEKAIGLLAVSLGNYENTTAAQYVLKQIDTYHLDLENFKKRLHETEEILKQQELQEAEFNMLKNMLSSIGKSIDGYSVEEKRSAIKTLIRKIVWDGQKVHVYLFNHDGEYEFPAPMLGESADAKPDFLAEINEPQRENRE